MTGIPNSLKLRHGWPFPVMKDEARIRFITKSSFVVPVFGSISKFWLNWLNIVKVYNASTFDSFVNNRPPDQPLITISNHVSCLDDPLLYGILPWRSVLSYSHMRWSLAAHDIIFTSRISSWFFPFCKCIPVVRGIGVNQKALDFCTDRLREGSWVHIFPEGKVNAEKKHLRLKWGVGRLIYDCWKGEYEPNSTTFVNSSVMSKYLNELDEQNSDKNYFTNDSDIRQKITETVDKFIDSTTAENNCFKPRDVLPGIIPIVLPIYHCGLDSILPNKKPYIPLVGKKVTVLVGEPMDMEGLIAKIDHMKLDRVAARKMITDHIQEEFYSLKKQAEHLHSLPHSASNVSYESSANEKL